MGENEHTLIYEKKYRLALDYLVAIDDKCGGMSSKIRSLIATASIQADPEKFKDDFPKEYTEYKIYNLI